MPKPPPDARRVEIRAVRRGERIKVPVEAGVGSESVRAPGHGIYFLPQASPHGWFVDGRRLYDELDKTLDFSDD